MFWGAWLYVLVTLEEAEFGMGGSRQLMHILLSHCNISLILSLS